MLSRQGWRPWAAGERLPAGLTAAGAPAPAADTPGLHIAHRATHLLSPGELQALHPSRPLVGRPAPEPPARAAAASRPGAAGSSSNPGTRRTAQQQPAGVSCSAVGTYYWGNLARVDVLQGPPGLRLAFHAPECLPLLALPLQPADDNVLSEEQVKEQQALAGPAAAAAAATAGDAGEQAAGTAAAGALAHRPLKLRWEKELPPPAAGSGGSRGWRCVGDVTVSGVHGWLSLHVRGPWREPVRLRAWVPRQVEAFLRYPLPVPGPFQDQQRQQQQEQEQAEQQALGEAGVWQQQAVASGDAAAAQQGSGGWAGEDLPAGGGDGGWVELEAPGSGWGSAGSRGRGRGAPAGAPSRAKGSSREWDPFDGGADELPTDAEMERDLARFGLDAIYGSAAASAGGSKRQGEARPGKAGRGKGRGGAAGRGAQRGPGRARAEEQGRGRSGGGSADRSGD